MKSTNFEARSSVIRMITVPNDPMLVPLLLTNPMQIIAYLTAFEKGTDVDQPRNLAESMTAY